MGYSIALGFYLAIGVGVMAWSVKLNHGDIGARSWGIFCAATILSAFMWPYLLYLIIRDDRP